jgi:oligosaccharide reducing-end xylanase
VKLRIASCLLLAVFWLPLKTFAQDTNFWIFICFGQSNMEGFPGLEPQDQGPVDERFQVLAAVDFPKQNRTRGTWYPAVPPLSRPIAGIGPADYFGRTLVAHLPPEIKVGVVNVAVPGCKIELFEPENYQAYAATAPAWMTNVINGYGGNPYRHLVEAAKLAQHRGVVKGILLHQGESNTNDKEWPEKVKGVYHRLLADLNLKAESVPLLAGEVVAADQKGLCASMNQIIDDLPKTISTAHIVSSAGCASRPDHLHFTPAGYRELGKRYAEALLPLLGFPSGKSRNLFAEAGHSPAEIRHKIDSSFQQLFHGNPTNEAVYFAVGSNASGALAYITDIKHHDVRTEGMSYGMMIAVQLDRKAEFDALWNWSKTYLYVSATNHPSAGFFAWQARTNGGRMSQFVAPDGEEYYVMALYFAAHRWGNGPGIYDYQAEADELLARMRHRPKITSVLPLPRRNTNVTVTAGALFDEEHKMVLFSPSSEGDHYSDPSYHLPAFYELWARWGPKADAEFWRQAAEVSRDFFVKTTHPVTGLNPCYANFDGSLVPRSGNYGTNFSYDAFRTAGNWAVDWSWWGKDRRQQELSDRLQAFFESQGTNYGCVFTLDGKPLEARHAQGLVAVNAVASLAATHPRAKTFVEELWNTPPPDGVERYYEGLLYLMSLLHCSGEFKVW